VRLEILDQAEQDLLEGFRFYEDQEPGLGAYFLTNLFSDIESLRLYGGIHRQAYRTYHRLLSKRFPFAVFYKIREETVWIHAVLDCRQNPAWIRHRLKAK
jgi:plasmid stabilization system protein ParE